MFLPLKRSPSYIRLHFPSVYLLKVAEILLPGCKYQYIPYTKKMTEEMINTVLEDKGVSMDLLRTGWKVKNKKRLCYNDTPSQSIKEMVLQQMQAYSEEAGLNLTTAEVCALNALATSYSGKGIQEGGILSVDFMLSYWGISQNIDMYSQDRPDHEISRIAHNHLRVLNRGCFLDTNKINKEYPLIKYYSYVDIKQEGSTFYYEIQDHFVFIEENIWHTYFLGPIQKKLAQENLNNENLFVFIPYLSDPHFAQDFLRKLNDYTHLKELAFTYINLCFPGKVEKVKYETNRNKAKAELNHMIDTIETNIIKKGSNSTEIKKITKKLRKTLDQLNLAVHDHDSIEDILKESMQAVQNIAHHALQGWHNQYATSHFFGKGRHQNIDWLYNQLAKPIDEDKTSDPFEQIMNITKTIECGKNFVF